MLVAGLSAVQSLALDVNVTASPYNAVPDDGLNDSTAFYNAFNAVVASGGGTIFVPRGEYHFTTRISVNLASTRVCIAGEGKGVSVIHCTNSLGLFWFNNSSSSSNELIMRDLSFTADRPSAGTAIQINNPSYCSDENICNLRMEGVVFTVSNFANDYFTRAVYASYLQKPVFIDIIFAGPLVALGAPETPSEYGFRINYGNAPYFENCYSKCVDYAYYLANLKGDVILNRCVAVGTETGLVVSATSAENCTVSILDTHSNALQHGIVVENADAVELQNGLSYCANNAVTYTDYTINNCSNVNITGCNFYQPFATTRTLIKLLGTTSNVLIKHNIFNSSGTRVYQDYSVANVSILQNLDNPTHQW